MYGLERRETRDKEIWETNIGLLVRVDGGLSNCSGGRRSSSCVRSNTSSSQPPGCKRQRDKACRMLPPSYILKLLY